MRISSCGIVAVAVFLLGSHGSLADRYRADFEPISVEAELLENGVSALVDGTWTFEIYVDDETRRVDYFSVLRAERTNADGETIITGASSNDTREFVSSSISVSTDVSGAIDFPNVTQTNAFLLSPSSTSSLVDLRYFNGASELRMSRNSSFELISCTRTDSCGLISVDISLPFLNQLNSPAFDMTSPLRAIPDGDVNGDGSVTFADFLQLSSNFGKEDPQLTFKDGDFDYSDTVDFADFLTLSSNFGTTLSTAETASVPEPSLHLWSCLCLLTLFRRDGSKK